MHLGPDADPICAPATPLLPSAVAILRISGEHLASVLSPLVELPPPRQAQLRWLCWDGYRERALVLAFPGPGSYTGEDIVELQIHGNPLLARRLLEHLGTLGIRLAKPGEFTRRALLNGRMDLLQVEALGDLVSAATDTQVRQAQARAGAQPAWVQEARKHLGHWVARAEAAVDYGEDEGLSLDMAALKADLVALRSRFHVEQGRSLAARWLRDGIRVAIVGRPNAGKSTLFNALAREDRAIVTEIPGTTRDVLEVRTEWAGLPLWLSDTAGLRHTDDRLETLGVARVAAVLEQADLVLHLVPVGETVPDRLLVDVLAPHAGKLMEVRTFADLGDGPGICISAPCGDLGQLEHALRARFLGEWAPDACLGALATQRQRELLEELIRQVELILGLSSQAPPELAASALQGMWGLLASLTGEDRADTALDALFQGFCLGK